MVQDSGNNNCLELCLWKDSQGQKTPCNPMTTSFIEKANLLTIDHNLKSVAAKNQMVFKYLYFLLCINAKAGLPALPPLFKTIIEAKFTNNGELCPPFKEDPVKGFYWVGLRNNDGDIVSALGVLKTGMYKDVVEDQNGKVYFRTTGKYLKG